MRAYLILFVIIFLAACDSGNKNPYAGDQAIVTPTITQPFINAPDACTLLTGEQVEEIFGLQAGEVRVRDGNPGGDRTRTCFFQWTDPAVSGNGILVQTMTNPSPDDFPDWPVSFVQNKRDRGERKMGVDEPYYFNKLEGVGDDGSYHYELGMYFWRIKSELVLCIAFNMEISEKEQMKAARKMAAIIMGNL